MAAGLETLISGEPREQRHEARDTALQYAAPECGPFAGSRYGSVQNRYLLQASRWRGQLEGLKQTLLLEYKYIRTLLLWFAGCNLLSAFEADGDAAH
jgi:hypothetical protein